MLHPLASRAHGHVLEVAVGTGRNLSFYNWSTLLSLSHSSAPDTPRRARSARERVIKLMEMGKGSGLTLRERRERGEGVGEYGGRVRPDTGRIILLEHGRGFYDWVNGKLDKYAPGHFRKYGCWWNRDIEGLVREAAERVPGLEVVKLERPGWFQAGTTLLIELRVKSQQGAETKV
ncbi:hypothetical protein N0V88_005418 [Collariella sp. IMI 366227]|nr:hypothetical protein N0V88_005418 [Collariella sp. IMI 366227]